MHINLTQTITKSKSAIIISPPTISSKMLIQLDLTNFKQTFSKFIIWTNNLINFGKTKF